MGGDLDIYLASLIGSWRALARPHADARVVVGDGFVAAVFDSHPVFDNALLLEPRALEALRSCYPPGRKYAIWTATDDAAAELIKTGHCLEEATTPMVLHLADLVAGNVLVPTGEPVDPGVIAELNGLPSDLLAKVPGARAYRTRDGLAGLVLIEVGSDVNVSFVATRPEARRRGLATGLLRSALSDARIDGFTTSSLQSTPMARGVYLGVGYRPVGTWQEWVR